MKLTQMLVLLLELLLLLLLLLHLFLPLFRQLQQKQQQLQQQQHLCLKKKMFGPCRYYIYIFLQVNFAHRCGQIF